MFSTSFISVESPRLTKFCDLFVKVGILHQCSAERSGQVMGFLPRGSHRKLKGGSEFMKTSLETESR